jgi:hypothetical protein
MLFLFHDISTDMCLIKNNAKVAAQISVELEKLQLDSGDVTSYQNGNQVNSTPVVIGGSILDVHYQVLDENLEVSSLY